MKTIKRYEAEDGCVFDSESKCLRYEVILNEVKRIMKPFGILPDEAKFINGCGYIQHSLVEIKRAKKELHSVSVEYLKLKNNVSFHFLGRYLDDSDATCLYHAWIRFARMDVYGREWGQPYYANHPEEGKQVQYRKTIQTKNQKHQKNQSNN